MREYSVEHFAVSYCPLHTSAKLHFMESGTPALVALPVPAWLDKCFCSRWSRLWGKQNIIHLLLFCEFVSDRKCTGQNQQHRMNWKKIKIFCLCFPWLLKKNCQAYCVFQFVKVFAKWRNLLNLKLSDCEWAVKLCKNYGNVENSLRDISIWIYALTSHSIYLLHTCMLQRFFDTLSRKSLILGFY